MRIRQAAKILFISKSATRHRSDKAYSTLIRMTRKMYRRVAKKAYDSGDISTYRFCEHNANSTSLFEHIEAIWNIHMKNERRLKKMRRKHIEEQEVELISSIYGKSIS